MFNHLEYDLTTLKEEYDRDLAKGDPIDVAGRLLPRRRPRPAAGEPLAQPRPAPLRQLDQRDLPDHALRARRDRRLRRAHCAPAPLPAIVGLPERRRHGQGRDKPEKPFDGAVSRFVKKDAPKDVREALEDADKKDILDPRYPYQKRLDEDDYEEAYARLPARARQAPDLVPRHRPAHRHRPRGPRRRRQGRHHRGLHREPQPRAPPAASPSPPPPTSSAASGTSSATWRTCRPRARWCSSTAPGTTAPWSSTSSAGAPPRSAPASSPSSPSSRTCWCRTASSSSSSGSPSATPSSSASSSSASATR